MKFGETLKDLRRKAGMTQEKLAEALDITKRTVINYEMGNRIPKNMGFYQKVSEYFGIPLESLLTEQEEFSAKAHAEGGAREKRKAEMLITEASALFSGGTLTEEDKESVFMALQAAYWEAKHKNKKYAPKRRKKS